jgi:hypothetical protein
MSKQGTGTKDILVRLRPLDCAQPVEIRLRRLLKAALRAYGFRCTSVEIEQPAANLKPAEQVPCVLGGLTPEDFAP